MSLGLICLAIGLLLGSGIGTLLTRRHARLASVIGAYGAAVACALALFPAVRILLGSPPASLRLPWSVPFGSFSLVLDPLAAFFLVVVAVVGALSAIYGRAYMQSFEKRGLGASWFFYDVLLAAMMLVVLAANGVLFLVAWEVMALCSFFLVTFEHEDASVRRAGVVYLVATHAGTAFLLAFFLLCGRGAGTLDFARFAAPAGLSGLLFVLACVGFGTKAGLVPVHVWLPEAHPVAPSHVSALMSAAMIKLGIYGLLRMLPLLGPPSPWWGWTLVLVGMASGLGGVLFALSEGDFKRLLAFSSVENAGIIVLSLGLGLLGVALRVPAVAGLGFAGALLHVWSHAAFKSLLFLGSGAVLHATETRRLDRLGGHLKRMPVSGACVLAGVVAICALPGGNGLTSELVIYLAAFTGAGSLPGATGVPFVMAVLGLALMGGLALLTFAKAFGIAFLGEPRTEQARRAHEVPWEMRLPMVALALLCVLAGLGAPALLRLVFVVMAGSPSGVAPLWASSILATLRAATVAILCLVALASILAILRHWLLARREVREAGTWDCGYARPGVSMQYTASSFAQPMTRLVRPLLGTAGGLSLPEGAFPKSASFATFTPSPILDTFYAPLFAAFTRALRRLRWIQGGRIQLYILYVAITIIVLLAVFLP